MPFVLTSLFKYYHFVFWKWEIFIIFEETKEFAQMDYASEFSLKVYLSLFIFYRIIVHGFLFLNR